MLRSEWFRLVMLLCGLCLLLVLVLHGLFSYRHLAPAEMAVVGDWVAREPDGSHTVLSLHRDRTCRIVWFDGAGNEKAMPPLEGNWHVADGTMVTKTVRTGSNFVVSQSGPAWTFTIEGDTLILAPQSKAPVRLRRRAAP
jgi:hypothetical protein